MLTLLAALMTPALSQEAPACDDTARRQLDLLVGRWLVTGPDGAVAGEAQFERILGGCALEERWSDAEGGEGRSLSAYDSSDGRWHQTRVDADGQRLALSGGLEGEAVVLRGERREGDAVVLNELRWTPSGDDIEQRWRVSDDGGERWSDVFEGRYTRAGDSAVPTPEYLPMSGDVIFHTSQDAQSLAVQLATGSRYSHVGIVAVDDEGDAYVYEAVGPVTSTPLQEWIDHGDDGRFTAMRLADPSALTDAVLARMAEVGLGYLGLPYDWAFGWSDERIYCSELVWKVYQEGAGIELSELQTIREFDLSHPAVQEKIAERYPDGVPLDEPAVSPRKLATSDRLVTIYSNYK